MEDDVTTDLRVRFGQEGQSCLALEIDYRDGGLNGGRRAFASGETAWFFLWQSRQVVLEGVTLSGGALLDRGSLVLEREEELFFRGEAAAVLSVPADQLLAVVWLGRSLGTLSLQDDAMTVRVSQPGVAVAQVRYRATARVLGVRSPPTLAGRESFAIAVQVSGRTP